MIGLASGRLPIDRSRPWLLKSAGSVQSRPPPTRVHPAQSVVMTKGHPGDEVLPAVGGLGLHPIDFTQVLIAANGDTLSLEAGPFWVTVDDEWWDFGAETPIASGTGRFVGASGTSMRPAR